MTPPPRRDDDRKSRAGTILRGLFLLGTGRSEGFQCFGNGRDAFLSSLAPPLAFLVVLAAELLIQHPSPAAVCLLLLFLIGIVLPPNLSHLMARIWKRTDEWPRYATASSWSIWLALPAFLPALVISSILLTAGIDKSIASNVAAVALAAYMLWLQWFLIWKGLRLKPWQAVVTTFVLMVGSTMVAMLLNPLLPLLQGSAQI